MMNRIVWVRADKSEEPDLRKQIVTTSLENDLMNIVIREGDLKTFKKLGKYQPVTIDENEISWGDLKGAYVIIENSEDERKAADLAGELDLVLVSVKNWKVIPIENLIARFQGTMTKLLVEINDEKEIRLLLETLETGVDGIVLSPKGIDGIHMARRIIDQMETEEMELVSAEITSMRPVGMGDRVCIDTCSILEVGEGMLIGSQSSGFFLVHSESVDSEYVDTRPFRVNAGPIHSYVMTPGDKTMYLSDLKVGDEVIAVDQNGSTRPVVIGRLKIERRPLLLVEATYEGSTFNIILQNAETIRLVSNNEPVSIVDLKVGDPILMSHAKGGRHFGMKVQETIIEK